MLGARLSTRRAALRVQHEDRCQSFAVVLPRQSACNFCLRVYERTHAFTPRDLIQVRLVLSSSLRGPVRMVVSAQRVFGYTRVAWNWRVAHAPQLGVAAPPGGSVSEGVESVFVLFCARGGHLATRLRRRRFRSWSFSLLARYSTVVGVHRCSVQGEASRQHVTQERHCSDSRVIH